MPRSFTNYSNDTIWSTEPEKTLDYLKESDNFRPFSEGLTELMKKNGYKDSEDDIDAKTAYVLNKLSSIQVPITKSTIKDWFADKRRPGFTSTSRTLMYQLCFALSVSYEDVIWFFNHIYFNRGFNCHTIEEAVYYYCFNNKLPYPHAQDLIAKINTFPVIEDDNSPNVFTQNIRVQLDHCHNDEELLLFFKENKATFYKWNQSALSSIKYYISEIQGKPDDKQLFQLHRADNNIQLNELNKCGLVIQEYFYRRKNGILDYDIAGKNITSIDFMLERIIGTNTGMQKDVDIPDIIRVNFPSKKTFSDILKKSETSTSYDSIRKCLVLLQFYYFWTTLLLKPELVDEGIRYDTYCDEINNLLTSCGYEELYAGNPYDRLFLNVSTADKPLNSFRKTINKMEL